MLFLLLLLLLLLRWGVQTVENACATQAILSVLLNRREEIKDLGENLKALWDFIKDFQDPTMRGEAIGGWFVTTL